MSQRQDLPEVRFARRMKRERTRRGWSQERLAREVAAKSRDAFDLHPTAITKMEREGEGRRHVRLDDAIFIAQAFGLSLPEMLTESDLGDLQRELDAVEKALEEQSFLVANATWELQAAQSRAAELHQRRADYQAQLARERAGEDG